MFTLLHTEAFGCVPGIRDLTGTGAEKTREMGSNNDPLSTYARWNPVMTILVSIWCTPPSTTSRLSKSRQIMPEEGLKRDTDAQIMLA
jgi:uncharacterized sodium:solute symporter family permease YidK